MERVRTSEENGKVRLVMCPPENKNNCICWLANLTIEQSTDRKNNGFRIFDYCRGCPDLETVKSRALGRRRADTASSLLIDKLFERVHSCRVQLVDTSSDLRKRIEELTILKKVTDYLLKTDNLEKALAMVLTGVTSGEAFGYNRAAIFLCDPHANTLRGVAAIGSVDLEEAKRIWMQFDRHLPTFDELLERIRTSDKVFKDSLYEAIWKISIPLSETQNTLLDVLRSKKSFILKPGMKLGECCPQIEGIAYPSGFVAVPIATDSLDFGVLIADNFVTKAPISEDDLLSLETFANTTAAALENIGLENQLKFRLEELERAHDLLRENQSYLVQHERLADIGKLATTVTHEIKTPLVTIGAYTRRLLTTFGTKRFKREHLEVILHEVERLERISGEILDYSKDTKLQLEKCDLNVIIESTMEMIKEKLKDAGIKMKNRFHQESIQIMADANRIRQVLYNLVQNAMDATDPGGMLIVRTRIEQSYAVMEVEDTGAGISDEIQEKLFTPFFSTKAKGSGLGLPVAKKIIDDHGGFMKVVTREGIGSRFSVYLPMISEGAET